MIVLESTAEVMQLARHVSIDEAAIARWSDAIAVEALKPKGQYLLGNLGGTQASLANLVLLIDSLNFCFWSSNPISIQWRGQTYQRFEAMFVSIMMAARHEPGWSNPEFWLQVPSEEIRTVLAGKGELLLMDDRERIIRETAQTLIERFDGQFINAIESVGNRAWPLAVLLMTEFDSFRDVAPCHGQIVYIMKRAQICALDISIAWQTHEFPSLGGLDELTAFADYRVPQALRHLGILRLTPELAARIESGTELAAGGEEEVEIRAATIQAVDMMIKSLSSLGKRVTAWQVDWFLWETARGPNISANHHRTRTVYY